MGLEGLAVIHPTAEVGTTAIGRTAGMLKEEPRWCADKLVCRVVSNGLKIKELIRGPLSSGELKIKSYAEDGKMIFGMLELPDTTMKFGQAVDAFVQNPSLSNFYQAFVKGCAFGAPANDGYDFARKHLVKDMPGPLTVLVKGIGPIALGIGMVDMMYNKVKDLTKEIGIIASTKLGEAKGKDKEKKAKIVRNSLIKGTKSGLDFVFAVTYFVLAILTFSAFWFGLVIPGVVMLAISVTALVAQITAKFWDKILVQAIPPQRKV